MASPFVELPHARARTAAAMVVAAVLGAVAMLPLVMRSQVRDDSAEAGFARDMATHHAQAVDMAFVIRDKSTDPTMRTLAYDIITTQSTQRGVFMGWLQAWGLPQGSSRPRMAWMPGHAAMPQAAAAPLMHGMASEAELQQLRSAAGRDAEVLFLQLMIRHHEGGVIMARAVRDVSRHADVISTADHIESTQRAEIVAMQEMLAARSARPLPSLLE